MKLKFCDGATKHRKAKRHRKGQNIEKRHIEKNLIEFQGIENFDIEN
jgi:hypothetical protein